MVNTWQQYVFLYQYMAYKIKDYLQEIGQWIDMEDEVFDKVI